MLLKEGQIVLCGASAPVVKTHLSSLIYKNIKLGNVAVVCVWIAELLRVQMLAVILNNYQLMSVDLC